MMNNRQLADTFTLIANLCEIKGEVIYVILAYRKASESLMSLGREASEYWKEGKLREIPGVGKAIAEKIDELLTTGKLAISGKTQKGSAAGPGRLAASARPWTEEDRADLEDVEHHDSCRTGSCRERRKAARPARAWAPNPRPRILEGHCIAIPALGADPAGAGVSRWRRRSSRRSKK